jgi:hypothetical protein
MSRKDCTTEEKILTGFSEVHTEYTVTSTTAECKMSW